MTETAKNLEKSLKEDIQQLNRCIVDKNAKISTLELFSKTNNDDLKKKNHELENVFKRARDEVTLINKLFCCFIYTFCSSRYTSIKDALVSSLVFLYKISNCSF